MRGVSEDFSEDVFATTEDGLVGRIFFLFAENDIVRARRLRVSERNKQKDDADDHETESGKSGRELSCMRKRERIALEIKGTFVALFSSIRPSPDNGGHELVLSFSRDVRPLRTSTFLFSLWLYVYIIEKRKKK